jgi:hypothetical protein
MTTFASLDVVEVTTDQVREGSGGVSSKRSSPPRYISFPKDLDITTDPTSESGFKMLPYLKLNISEIKRDQGLPATGPGTTDSDATARSIASGSAEAVSALTSPIGLGFISAAIASRLNAGVAVTAITGAAGAAAGEYGDAAISSILGLSKDDSIGNKFKSRLENFGVRRNVEDIKTQIILPMPENIGVAYDQQYLEAGMTQALGLPGLATQAFAARQGGAPIKALEPYALELATSLAQNIPGVGSNADRILFFGSTGLVVNPQLEMLFTSSALRRFVLDFKLTPKNKDDSLRLFSTDYRTGIISALKYYSAPEIPNNLSTGRYFIPPAQFELEFYRGGNYKNQSLFKTKKCVLTSVSVDYTPNGYITHEDGSPAQISLQLNFVETSIISRSDYLNGKVR